MFVQHDVVVNVARLVSERSDGDSLQSARGF
jgi:hypothetical protein